MIKDNNPTPRVSQSNQIQSKTNPFVIFVVICFSSKFIHFVRLEQSCDVYGVGKFCSVVFWRKVLSEGTWTNSSVINYHRYNHQSNSAKLKNMEAGPSFKIIANIEFWMKQNSKLWKYCSLYSYLMMVCRTKGGLMMVEVVAVQWSPFWLPG